MSVAVNFGLMSVKKANSNAWLKYCGLNVSCEKVVFNRTSSIVVPSGPFIFSPSPIGAGGSPIVRER